MYECLPPWTVNRSVIQRSPVFRSAPARSKNYLPFGEFFAAGYLVPRGLTQRASTAATWRLRTLPTA